MNLAQHINLSVDRWPSGRRRSPAKGVGEESSRGFESLRLRHFPHYHYAYCHRYDPAFRAGMSRDPCRQRKAGMTGVRRRTGPSEAGGQDRPQLNRNCRKCPRIPVTPAPPRARSMPCWSKPAGCAPRRSPGWSAAWSRGWAWPRPRSLPRPSAQATCAWRIAPVWRGWRWGSWAP